MDPQEDSLGKKSRDENFPVHEPSPPIFITPGLYQNVKLCLKNFEVDISVLSKFVWPDLAPSVGFFGVLARHGGVYIRNMLESGNVDLEMEINIGDICALDFLTNIFGGKIPVDCSLFLQILLQKDFKNRIITLRLGPLADVEISVHAKVRGLQIGYYMTKDITLHSLLQKSPCIAKSQWVIKTVLDQYLGMTRNGPEIHSDLEWRTHMADGINYWLRDDDKLCVSGSMLQQAMRGLAVVNVQIHCDDNGITIDADQIIFNGGLLTSLFSYDNYKSINTITRSPSTNIVTMSSPENSVAGTAPNNSTLEGKELDPIIWMSQEFQMCPLPKIEVFTSSMVGGLIVFSNHIPTSMIEGTRQEDRESRTRSPKVEEVD